MTTTRSYRQAMAPGEARAELEHCAGAQFDPHVVQALLATTQPATLSQSAPAESSPGETREAGAHARQDGAPAVLAQPRPDADSRVRRRGRRAAVR